MTDPLDDLIQNTRDDVPVSPQDEERHKKKLSADKFFNAAKELTSEGTYKGKAVEPKDRKTAFKMAKKDDRVGFKSFLDDVTKKGEGEEEKGNDKWFKAINENLKSILGAMNARAKVDEDAAKTTKRKDEKASRKAKEASGEKPKGGPVKGIVSKITQPITSIWEKIIQGFGVLLAGWGLGKVLKWFQENPQAATDLGTFLSNHLPKIFGGILALLALDLGIKIAKFTAVMVKGVAGMIVMLWKMVGAIVAFCIANPLLALAIGLGALLVGGAVWAASRKKSKPAKKDQKPFKSDSNFEVENDGKVTKAAGGGLIRGYEEGGKVKEEEKEKETTEVTNETNQEIIRKKELDEKTVQQMPLDNLYTSGKDMEESGLDEVAGDPEKTGIMEVMSGESGLKTAENLIPSDTQAFDEGGEVKKLTQTSPDTQPDTQAFDEGGEVKKLTWTNPDVQANAEGTDTEPAMLRPDQFVMSKGAVNKFGVDTLEGMNADGGVEARGGRELGQRESDRLELPELPEGLSAGGGLPELGGGGAGTNSLTETAKVKTTGSAIGDFFSGDDGRSRRMTEQDRSQRMAGGGKVQRFSGGGKADARGTDTVPAMLTPGEFVMSRGAVQKWGVDTLEGMNAAGGGTNKPKIAERVYAAGGGVIGGGDTNGDTKKTSPQPMTVIGSTHALVPPNTDVSAISPNTDGSASTASQLISSPPSGGKSSSDVEVLPISTGMDGGSAPSGTFDSEIPWHKAHDDTNLSSLIIKNLYQIVQ